MENKVVEPITQDVEIPEKIYVICCDESRSSMGFGHIRTAVEGVQESTLNLDWTKVRSVPIISVERYIFEAHQTLIVKIIPVTIPPKSAIIRSFYGSNGMGTLTCVGSTEFKSFDEERTGDRAMFTSRIKADMMRGDLLGHIFIIPGT